MQDGFQNGTHRNIAVGRFCGKALESHTSGGVKDALVQNDQKRDVILFGKMNYFIQRSPFLLFAVHVSADRMRPQIRKDREAFEMKWRANRADQDINVRQSRLQYFGIPGLVDSRISIAHVFYNFSNGYTDANSGQTTCSIGLDCPSGAHQCAQESVVLAACRDHIDFRRLRGVEIRLKDDASIVIKRVVNKTKIEANTADRNFEGIEHVIQF